MIPCDARYEKTMTILIRTDTLSLVPVIPLTNYGHNLNYERDWRVKLLRESLIKS
jgi:hypothetical protein